MCSKDSAASPLTRLIGTPLGDGPEGMLPPAERAGSRRRRVWELPVAAHCPVIGVCLPIASLRRLTVKALGGQATADDYELHCGVISDCRQRSPMGEAVQRELDRRCATAVTQAARCKSTDTLRDWWAQQLEGIDLAGALWATLTHSRCDGLLEERVLRDIHMVQHQLGTSRRADLQHLGEVLDENAVLGRELGAAQQRSTRVALEQGRKIEQQQGEVMRLRAALVGRDTLIASLSEELRSLEESLPDLKSRVDLGRQSERQLARIHDLERTLLRTQHLLEREQRRHAEVVLVADSTAPVEVDDLPAATPARLDDRAVLCVGGRQASVPVYKRVIEGTGGRFMHHDGGEEDSSAMLDHSLAAADLVICQTGCISHDAYWRVKDHCKRTGKRCLFVEKPSRASLQRALNALSPASLTGASTETVDAAPTPD